MSTSARRRRRRTALVLTGLAVVAAGAGFYWLAKEDDGLAGPMLGIAGGLATAGIVSFAVSVTWD